MTELGSPRVTVLMPVYNGENYLCEAIESILTQTFDDFEFLIINDGSTDRSAEIIESYPDSRIRLVHNESNLKLIATLNKGLELARGKYIARMDCDDISLSGRLSRQVAFLNDHPEVGVCGTWIKTLGEVEEDVIKYPLGDEEIRSQLIFESPFAHPSVMMRRDMVSEAGIRYSHESIHAEDYDFWVRLSKICRFANIGEVLLLYRMHSDCVGKLHEDEQRNSSRLVRQGQIRELGLLPSEEELYIHECASSYERQGTKDYIGKVNAWLNKLRMANNNLSVYPEPAFSSGLGERWFETCYYASALGLWTWKSFWASDLSRSAKLTFKQKMLFALKCGIKYDDAGRA